MVETIIRKTLFLLATLLHIELVSATQNALQDVPKLELYSYGYTDFLRIQVDVGSELLDFAIDTGSDLNVADYRLQNELNSPGAVVKSKAGLEFLQDAILKTSIGEAKCPLIALHSFADVSRGLAVDISGIIGIPVLSSLSLECTAGKFAIVYGEFPDQMMSRHKLIANTMGVLSTDQIVCGGEKYGPVVIASGSDSAISVPSKIFEKMINQGILVDVQSVTSVSMRGKSLRRIGICKDLKIWDIDFHSVPVSEAAFDQASVGLELLRRIDFLLSFKDQQIFVRENRLTKTPFLFNRTGLSVVASGESIEVESIAPNSPAERSGLKVGDVVRSFNGSELSRLRLHRLRQEISVLAPGQVVLEVTRHNQPVKVILTTP